jgi:hypothetical protein
MANTIILSSHPKARTMRVRTKMRSATLISEIPRKTEVTIRIALLRLASRVATSIVKQMVWGIPSAG